MIAKQDEWMITPEKLRIYEKWGGDLDGFARGSELSERLSITDQDWRLIDEILQSLLIIQSGFASEDFETNARARTIDAAQDEDVRERLFQLSMPPKTYVIDGEKFSTLEEFAEHFNSRVDGSYPGRYWSWPAFNDILRGGFGTPEQGFRLVWEHADLSRQRLGDNFDGLVSIIESHSGDEESPVLLELRGRGNTMIQTLAPHRHLNGHSHYPSVSAETRSPS